jgi:beta-galactosidase
MRSPLKKSILVSFFFFPAHLVFGQVSFGDPVRINEDWRFQKGDHEQAAAPDYDDSGWRELNLPHDWSVEGPYNPDLASGTGYLPGGIAWYRKTLNIPTGREGEKVYLYFEGVYRDAEVFINGTSLGMRPNGYISYLYDLTPHIEFGGANTLSVRVDHSKYADSRWYTGSGIYRDVYLVFANPVHIDPWGVFFTTPRVSTEEADVEIWTAIRNDTSERAELTVVQEIFGENDVPIASVRGGLTVGPGETENFLQELKVDRPELWSIDTPNLYILQTSVNRDDAMIDRTRTRVGFRYFDFNPDCGFFLNGESVTVKGVCLHHDAGSLGAAVPREVWERRLKTLRSLGANAIRTSHNPQAPVLYELCDELGFLVINEIYDEWELPKKKWIDGWNVGEPGFDGFAEFFEEWGEIDLRDTVLRDRNHASVFMWSIGNEVDYPNDPYSHPILDEEGIQQQHQWGYQPDQPHADRLGEIAHRLAEVVRENDPTRAVTAGLAGPVMSNETTYPDALDVVGYNYTERRYEQDHRAFPDRVFYGSENGHSMAAWRAVRDNEYIFGQFLWTGIDYLGESRPWPSRGATSGLMDLAGFIKPRGYFRQSLWTEEPMIFIGSYRAPSNGLRLSFDADPLWDYEKGDTIRVVVYTNCDEVRLLLNGGEAGERQEYDDETGIVYWDIPFEPGRLEAVGYRDGEEAVRHHIETSGPAHGIEAWAYASEISAARGVAQIEIRIVDEEGRPVVLAENEITCTTEGPVKLLGMEAGNPTDMGDYTDNRLRAYKGRMIVYVEALGEPGEATVRLTSPSLETAEVPIVLIAH